MYLSKEPLKTKRTHCFCGGNLKPFKNRFSTLTVYTESGPYQCEHHEYRCTECSKGFYFGYSTEVEVPGDDAKDDDESKRKYVKQYEEDCLEQDVSNVVKKSNIPFHLYISGLDYYKEDCF